VIHLTSDIRIVMTPHEGCCAGHNKARIQGKFTHLTTWA